jgi:alpha-L-fucosidase
MNVGPTKDAILNSHFIRSTSTTGFWLGVNREALYRSFPWSHQHDTLTDKLWYVSSISWRT